MKKLITCLFLLSMQVFPQTFIGVNYNNSDPANSTGLSSISKITFSGTNVIFMLTDNSSVTKSLSTISLVTFSTANGGNPLPVELVNFSVDVNGNKVILEWSTATEVNNYGFDVERAWSSSAADGSVSWSNCGFVKGSGNSNSPRHYSFTDSPEGGTKFNYRLKQIDNDGKYEYSKVVSVNLNGPNDFALNQNYPNPFNPTTIISYSLPIDGFVMLKVYDILGREVTTLVNENKKAGNYDVSFNGSRLGSGIYFCRMSYGDFDRSIKMIVMK